MQWGPWIVVKINWIIKYADFFGAKNTLIWLFIPFFSYPFYLRYFIQIIKLYTTYTARIITIKYIRYIHPSNHRLKKYNGFKWHPIIQCSKEEKFKITYCPFWILKAPVVSLLPNALHQAMRDNHPNNNIAMTDQTFLANMLKAQP